MAGTAVDRTICPRLQSTSVKKDQTVSASDANQAGCASCRAACQKRPSENWSLSNVRVAAVGLYTCTSGIGPKG